MACPGQSPQSRVLGEAAQGGRGQMERVLQAMGRTFEFYPKFNRESLGDVRQRDTMIRFASKRASGWISIVRLLPHGVVSLLEQLFHFLEILLGCRTLYSPCSISSLVLHI